MKFTFNFRCLIDDGFKQVKDLYDLSDIDTLADLQDIVNKSASTNEAVMYRQEDTWVWRDWKSFLGTYFKRVDGIMQYQHFRFDSSAPGYVFLRKRADDIHEIPMDLRSGNELPADTLPPVIQPPGLTQERMENLSQHAPAFRSEFFADTETEK